MLSMTNSPVLTGAYKISSPLRLSVVSSEIVTVLIPNGSVKEVVRKRFAHISAYLASPGPLTMKFSEESPSQLRYGMLAANCCCMRGAPGAAGYL
jgi:hypothetical protein